MTKGLWKLTWIEAKLFLREPIAAFFTLVFPLMMLFLFGSIYGNKPTPFFGGWGTVDVMVPAYMAMVIATTGLVSIAIDMATYRERGILRRWRATPLRPTTILAAKLIVYFLITLLGSLLVVIAGKLAYGLRCAGDVLSIFGAFTLSTLSFFSMGFILAGVAPTARAAQIIAMVLFYPMIFLSGAAIPREVLALSGTLKLVAKALPLKYTVDMLRGLWIGEAWSKYMTETWVLLGLLLIGVLISAKTFRWE